MKLTKIIATLGPSCESEELIEKLILKGVNIFRFNFKHNTVEWHETMIQKVRTVAQKNNLLVGTLIDLQGPEIRILLKTDSLNIVEGKWYSLGDGCEISLTHPEVYSHLKEGQKAVVDDGAFDFEIVRKNGELGLLAKSSGKLGNRKTLIVPGGNFPVELLVDRDLKGLELAGRHKIDYVALSFVRSSEDIKSLKDQMNKHGVSSKIVAKIETQKAIQNLASIVEVADIVMVARGDLGVEFPFEEVPYFQKMIIKECLEKGVPVITATQMLESMIENPYPTRAEISDVANATFDLTDAVMLSAETAIGAHPSKAVATMSRAVMFSEKITNDDVRLRHDYDVHDQTELLCDAAYNLYFQYRKRKKIKAFIILTQTGKTARTLSRYR
ncbi:MAG: pyruvate kinase, partial [Patescibacteria group bacterium]